MCNALGAMIAHNAFNVRKSGQNRFGSAAKAREKMRLDKACAYFKIGIVKYAVDIKRVIYALSHATHSAVIKAVVLNTLILRRNLFGKHCLQFRLRLRPVAARHINQGNILLFYAALQKRRD